MAFDLAAVLKDVSNLNTRDQIEYLPFELLDPDPENFYSLEGLNELADSIATVGLVHPLRVRPSGDRYTVTSGHRRRAAIQLLIDSGEDWSAGVPCIVDHGEALPEFTELKMIFANSQRTKSAAELSREAEKTEALLASLKEKGYEFPGRMQEHVAQALNVKTGKLKRLHAIRANLVPELLAFFDSGEMVEDVAYRLSRFPAEIQTALGEKLGDGRKHKMPVGSSVDHVWEALEELRKPFPCRAHAGGPDCHNLTGKIVRSLTQQYSWAACEAGKCCMDCYKSKEGCGGACREARDRANVEKAAEKEKQDEKRAADERAQEMLKARIKKRAAVLLPYAEAVGLKDGEKISGDYRSATVSQLRKWAVGDFGQEHFYGDECVKPAWTKDAAGMAKKLGCSLELAMDLPERKQGGEDKKRGVGDAAPYDGDPQDGAPRWRTGEPPEEGWYAVKIRFFKTEMAQPRVYWYDGKGWLRDRERCLPIDRDFTVTRWIPLPETEE